jgi:DNA repair photolyase
MSIKKSKGQMYSWVSHVHSHLGGECPHKCSYCYVGKSRFGRPERYTGPLRFLGVEEFENYGQRRRIFIEHMNDMFAVAALSPWIDRILAHCRRYPENEYIFQTKNPERVARFLTLFPKTFMVGTTVETNRGLDNSITLAPQPVERIRDIDRLKVYGVRVFITIEPIMDFDPVEFAGMIISVNPEFINIGADSKGCELKEPSAVKILQFIDILKSAGVTIKKKTNLERLIGRAKD